MNETPLPLNDSACAAFEAIVQSVLDGETPFAALNDAHTLACLSCREMAVAANVLRAGLDVRAFPTAPVGFVDRVVPVLAADRRRQNDTRRTYRIAACSLAASALIAFFSASPWRSDGLPPAAKASAPSATLARGPSVTESIADARSAVVSLTKRAATESISPAKSLFASLDPAPQNPAPIPPPPKDGASPVEPITNTAKRAMNLFIRDVSGLSPIHQRKS